MKKTFALHLALLMFTSITSANAEAIGDTNGDGQVGLPEAINALQVTAGVATTPPVNAASINFNEYNYQDNSSYIYAETTYSPSNPPSTTYSVRHSSIQEIDQKTMLLLSYPDGTDYSIISDTSTAVVRVVDSYGDITATPPIIYGKSAMQIGDQFSTIFKWSDRDYPYYRNFTVQGFEDVQTHAGLFTNCLKMSRVDGNSDRTVIYYFAKGVGRVKSIYFYTNGIVRSEELVSADVDGSYQGNNVTYCEGTISDGSTTYPIYYFYKTNDSNFPGQLWLNGQMGLESYAITSSDGTNFTCDSSIACLSLSGSIYTDYSGTSYPLNTTCTVYQ